MIEKILEKFIRKRRGKTYSAWQVELTTRCPLRCKMCLRAESDDWQSQEMVLQDFKRLLPYLKDVETVILEGWGESLLYEDLSECIRLVKKEGPQVGFVTSAKGLTQKRVSELLMAGIDFVGFSIAGTTEETHAAIRVNSHLQEILNAIRFFDEETVRQGCVRPRMHLVFLMVKDNVLEVPDVPSFAKGIGIEEVVLTNICHTINTWQEKQRVFSWSNDENDFEKLLKKAETNARNLHIRLRRPSLCPVEVPVCAENPLRNLYISVDGEVSPCVYLYPPLPSPFKRIFCSEEHRVERMSFGNLFKEPISTIWESEDYAHFRDCFARRRRKSRDLYLSLWDVSRSRSLEMASLPFPPESCKTCHKMLGV
jgi:MoaA/NifB/PqqE/SkfB family radical SAM enzyme